MNSKSIRILSFLATLMFCNCGVADDRIKVFSNKGLGTPLSTGYISQTVLSLIDSQLSLRGVSSISLVGGPYNPNQYLAFICISEQVADPDSRQSIAFQIPCMANSKDKPNVYIGLLEKQNDQFALLAKSKLTRLQPASIYLTAKLDWLTKPKFDLAVFKLNNREEAFSLSVDGGISNDGRAASLEALYLFKKEGQIINGSLVEFVGQRYATGYWQVDGTPEHSPSDMMRVLLRLPAKTDSNQNLRVDDQDPHVNEKQIYKWSFVKKYYLPI